MLFSSIKNHKHRTILMTAYGSGLRISEVIGPKVGDIDSSRMMIRIEKGKGDKDRYSILSPRLLSELRSYWLEYRPDHWLFPNKITKERLTRATPQLIFKAAIKKAAITKKSLFMGSDMHLPHIFLRQMWTSGPYKFFWGILLLLLLQSIFILQEKT